MQQCQLPDLILIPQTRRLVIRLPQRPKRQATDVHPAAIISFLHLRLLAQTPLPQQELFSLPFVSLPTRRPLWKLRHSLIVVRSRGTPYLSHAIFPFLFFDSNLPPTVAQGLAQLSVVRDYLHLSLSSFAAPYVGPRTLDVPSSVRRESSGIDGYQAMRLGAATGARLNNSRSSRREIRNMLPNISDFKANVFIDGNSVEAAERRPALGEVIGTPTRGTVFALVAALMVSGCAAAYAPAPLPVNHPASPAASEAPSPPPSQAFRDESILLVPTEEVPAQRPHSGHGAMQGGH